MLKNMQIYYVSFFVIVYLSRFALSDQYITYGSVLKLMNVKYNVRLHSHEVSYASGSKMQSVTGMEDVKDSNSLWAVKNKTGQLCLRGQPIKCGSVLRFEHLATSKNLHSHLFQSPLSGSEQEIAAFGTSGAGDNGDDWSLNCDTDYWFYDTIIRLNHVDTSVFLSASGRHYDQPIQGQMEIVGTLKPDYSTQWMTAEGIFYHYTSELKLNYSIYHKTNNKKIHIEL